MLLAFNQYKKLYLMVFVLFYIGCRDSATFNECGKGTILVNGVCELEKIDDSVSQKTTVNEYDKIYLSESLNKTIPDNDPNGISDDIIISENGLMKSLLVSLNIEHTWRGDLKVRLFKDAQEIAIVHARTGGSADNLIINFPVPNDTIQDQELKGTWTLKVSDHSNEDVGVFNDWALKVKFNQISEEVTIENYQSYIAQDTPLTIPDNNADGVISKILVADPGKVSQLNVLVEITHSYIGDLTITLLKDGQAVSILRQNEGGSDDNLSINYTVSEAIDLQLQGEWGLKVVDEYPFDDGSIIDFTISTISTYNPELKPTFEQLNVCSPATWYFDTSYWMDTDNNGLGNAPFTMDLKCHNDHDKSGIALPPYEKPSKHPLWKKLTGIVSFLASSIASVSKGFDGLSGECLGWNSQSESWKTNHPKEKFIKKGKCLNAMGTCSDTKYNHDKKKCVKNDKEWTKSSGALWIPGEGYFTKIKPYLSFLDKALPFLNKFVDKLGPLKDFIMGLDSFLGQVTKYVDKWTFAVWNSDSQIRKDLAWCIPYAAGGKIIGNNASKGTYVALGNEKFSVGTRYYQGKLSKESRVAVHAAGLTVKLFGYELPLPPTPSFSVQFEGLKRWASDVTPSTSPSISSQDIANILPGESEDDYMTYLSGNPTPSDIFPAYSPKPWDSGLVYPEDPQNPYASKPVILHYMNPLFIEMYVGPVLKFDFDLSKLIPPLKYPPLTFKLKLQTGFGFATQKNSVLKEYFDKLDLPDEYTFEKSIQRYEKVQGPDYTQTNSQNLWIKAGAFVNVGFSLWGQEVKVEGGFSVKVDNTASAGLIDYHNGWVDPLLNNDAFNPDLPCEIKYDASYKEECSWPEYTNPNACSRFGTCTFTILNERNSLEEMLTENISENECMALSTEQGSFNMSYQWNVYTWDTIIDQIIAKWEGLGCHPNISKFSDSDKEYVKKALGSQANTSKPRYTMMGFSLFDSKFILQGHVKFIIKIKKIFGIGINKTYEKKKSWDLYTKALFKPQVGVSALYDLDMPSESFWPGDSSKNVLDQQPSETRWRGYNDAPSTNELDSSVTEFLNECKESLASSNEYDEITNPDVNQLVDLICPPNGEEDCPMGWMDQDQNITTGVGGCEYECGKNLAKLGHNVLKEVTERYQFCIDQIPLQCLMGECDDYPTQESFGFLCSFVGNDGSVILAQASCNQNPQVSNNLVKKLVGAFSCYNEDDFHNLFVPESEEYTEANLVSDQNRVLFAQISLCMAQGLDNGDVRILDKNGKKISIKLCHQEAEEPKEIDSQYTFVDECGRTCHVIPKGDEDDGDDFLCFGDDDMCNDILMTRDKVTP